MALGAVLEGKHLTLTAQIETKPPALKAARHIRVANWLTALLSFKCCKDIGRLYAVVLDTPEAHRALESAGKEAWDCIWPLSLVDGRPGKEACELICSLSSVEGKADRGLEKGICGRPAEAAGGGCGGDLSTADA
ncbi:MAG: hypothetical protein FRX49_10457 [Trebouxia sp. A1-2]|nr:MAG: hypothetical protein FRX49_10457 [Trebouxia sp. A1-2]